MDIVSMPSLLSEPVCYGDLFQSKKLLENRN